MNKNNLTIEQILERAGSDIPVPSRDEFRIILGAVTKTIDERKSQQANRPSPFQRAFARHRVVLVAKVAGACLLVALVLVPKGVVRVGPVPVSDTIDSLVTELSAQADTEESMSTDDLDDETGAPTDVDLLAQIS